MTSKFKMKFQPTSFSSGDEDENTNVPNNFIRSKQDNPLLKQLQLKDVQT